MKACAAPLSIALPLWAFMFLAPSAVIAASPSGGPEAFLSADVDLVLVLEHPRALAEAWSRTPLGALLGDPRLHEWAGKDSTEGSSKRKLTDALTGGLDRRLEESTGHSLHDVLTHVEGPLAVVVDDLAPLLAKDAGGDSLRWGVLARGVDPAFYEETATTLRARKAECEDPERFPAWVEAGPWRILASPASYLHELAAAAAAGTVEGPLSGAPGFQSLRAAHPEADLTLAVNLADLAPAVRAAFAAGMEKNPEISAYGVDADALTKGLGLDALESLTLAMRCLPGETRIDQAVLVREDRGVVKLLGCLPGACPRPTYVPENAVLAWVNRFDPLASYRALVEMVQIVNPGLGTLVETQIRQIAVSAGLDLERDILARLGPDGFAAYLPPAEPAPEKDTLVGSLSEVSGCSSSDPEGLANAVQGILSSFLPEGGPEWETREVEGTTVHSAGLTSVPGKDDRFSYAVTSDLFLGATGDPRALEAVLHAHAHPGKGLWGRSDLAAAFAAIPADACAIGYADLGALFRRPRDFGPVVGSASKTERGIFSVTRFLAPAR